MQPPSPLELYESNKEVFQKYLELLKKWNQKINLTSLKSDQKIIELHFIDSLQLVTEIVPRETILDIGSGAGFPGIPIKIVCPNTHLTLVDSIKKKCDFMSHVVRELKLDNVEIIQTRIGNPPNPPLKKGGKGGFDVVLSRATFSMYELMNISLPYLKDKGLVIAMKGPNVDEEIQEVENISGYRLPLIKKEYHLPYSGQLRTLLIMKK